MPMIPPKAPSIYQIPSNTEYKKQETAYGNSMTPALIQSQSSLNDYKSYKKHSSKQNYENPISRKEERKLAIISGVATSVGAGALAGIASKMFFQGWKIPVLIGAAITGITAAVTLPAKLYQTKVNAFTKEKEMNVFSREKELKSNLLEDVNDEVRDQNVSLDQKIDHYTQIKMADNGQGVILKRM